MSGFFSAIDEKNFRTPDMGEYYDEDLIEEMMQSIDPNDPKNAAYYVEAPFSTKLGYHPDYEAFVLKADPIIKKTDSKYGRTTGAEKEGLNEIDADTIHYYLDSFDDGGEKFTINGETFLSFKDYVYNKGSFKSFKNGVISLRTVGINAPEVPHWTITPESENAEIIEATEDEMKRKGYIYEINKKRESGKKYGFINVGGQWRELRDPKTKDSNGEYTYGSKTHPYSKGTAEKGHKFYTYLYKDEQTAQDMDGDTNLGLYATQIALDLIESAQDMRLVVDAKQLQTSGNYSGIYQTLMNEGAEDVKLWDWIEAAYIKAFGKDVTKYNSFTTFGQDAYRRFLGATYLKVSINDSTASWVNLGKYVKAKVGDSVKLMTGLTPLQQATGNGLSDAFKVWSYDNSNTIIADGFYNISQADFDDRRAIQKEITGLDFATYRDYTVMIGDCLFMVPPTSIRIINQMESNRIPLLRSKGSMTKTKPHNDRLIEMTLYFNGEDGINGIPIEKQLPKQAGTDNYETYYMNGLRSLIAMFKYTPFLPIENKYLNDVLGIEAVSLANLQIQTMPMYPKCLAATLTLQQFNYRIYLNELPLPSPEEGEDFNYNMYARTINYGVMRYYYQRAIQAGEAIKNLDPTSQDFIEATMGSKTRLIPMEFQDHDIRFQILDENWLDKMDKVKELASKQPIQRTDSLNQKTVEWANRVGVSMHYIIKALPNIGKYKDSDRYVGPVDWLRDELIGNGKCPHLVDVTVGSNKDGSNIGFVFKFDTASLTKEELSNLMIAVTSELEIKKENADKTIFDDGTIMLNAKKTSDNKYVCDTSTDEYKVAQFFAFRSGMLGSGEYGEEINDDNWDGFAAISNEEFYEELKDNAIDTETLLSAKFKDYPLNIIAQQFSVSMGNTLSNTKLKVHEGYAPQYAGGQDTVLEFTFHTKDENTVTLINNMQQMAAEQLIRYRRVINCWPIRIDSELTRLCGIYEVVIESVDISTVPMHPGLFAVQCRAISVDRTMRNKESLRRLDTINNAGATNPDSVNSWVYNTYFDLNRTLAKAEVYPDLELPTIDELESTGYKFIRYSRNRENRVYPDPDFYFVYGYAYSAQMLRKTIIDYFSNTISGDDGELYAAITKAKTSFLQGGTSQEFFVSMNAEDPDQVLNYEAADGDLQAEYDAARQKDIEAIAGSRAYASKNNDAKAKLDAANKKLYNKSVDFENELIAMQQYSWDVSSSIKCTLPEDIVYEDDELKNEVEEDLKATEEKIIEIIDSILSNPIDASKYKNSAPLTGKKYQKDLRDEIKDFVNTQSKNGKTEKTWKDILDLFGADMSSKIKKKIRGIYEAAAMALSSNTEYSEDADKEAYFARAFFTNERDTADALPEDYTDIVGDSETGIQVLWYPYSLTVDKNTGDVYSANSLDRAIKEGITFGPYQIRRYDSEYLKAFYANEAINFNEMDFIDPYYNKALHKAKFGKDIDQTEYKTKIIASTSYAIQAFHRIVLLWVRKLINDKSYLSLYDTRRDDMAKVLGELKKEVSYAKVDSWYNIGTYTQSSANNENSGEYTPYNNENTATVGINYNTTSLISQDEDIFEIVKNYEDNMILGKVFLPTICAVTHGDNAIYDRIIAKDIGTLKVKTRSCQLPMSPSENISDGERNFRKMLRAMAGTDPKVLSGIDQISTESQSKLEAAFIDRNQKLWVKASEDPSLWVLHSYYDMTVNNKRGRMARAFPTYYMMLIDEGREIGYWKLHDNFYNMSSIAELEVVKSRKMPADTATIVMTNMFKTFTTEDEDIKVNYEHNVRDVFNSIFSPNVYFEEEEAKRMRQMEINRATIKPGVRVHIRMGYSGDASELPILFNGVVAEASNGEVIEIVAQGDGHEIVNSQAFATVSANDAADIQNESSAIKWFYNFFTEGATPKTLVKNIFTTKSGFIGKMVNNFTNGRFFNDNMFGITHFGEIDYKHFHKDGEIMQNIYEAEGRMPWHTELNPGSMTEQHATMDVPKFTIELKDKSVWDILNICASSSLEFIAGVAPFGIRSTMFLGRPHYYYAYDYTVDEKGTIYEKRKPYQQYHIIDSYSDIIGNNIKASGRDIKTVAVPTYKGPSAIIGQTEDKKCNPLWADWDIYPEYQKTMIVNTGMTWKGNKLGSLFINSMVNAWSKNGGQKIAWRMGATALKNSFKDMYQGEVIIIGDTSIKPLDKVYLHDIYENMNGAIEVEAVVHRLDPETGFTSSVFADCISTVDSRYEEIGRVWTNEIATQVMIGKGIQYGMYMAFANKTRPMLNILAKTVNKGTYDAANLANKAASFVGKDDLIKYTSMEDWSNKMYKTLGLSSDEVAIWNKLDKFEKWKDAIGKIDANEINSAVDIIDKLGDILNATDGVDPKDVAKALQEALDNNTIKKKDVEKIEEVVEALNKMNISNKNLTSMLKTLTSDSVLSEIDKIADISQESKDLLKSLKTMKEIDPDTARKAMKVLDEVKDKIDISTELGEAAKLLSKYGDDVSDIMTAAGKIFTDKKIMKSLTTVVTSAGVVSSVILLAAEMAFFYVLEKSLYNFIENTMASFNVLTVYPLKKNGSVHVAGIDGHKGLVVGSPTWNQQGPIDKFMDFVFGNDNWILNNFVFSDEMKAIYNNNKKDNKLGNYADVKESSISELLKDISEGQASSYSAYQGMARAQRISDIQAANAKYTYKKIRIKSDLDSIPSNDTVQNELVPIHSSNKVLEPYFDKFLKIAHEESLEYQDEADTDNKISKSVPIKFDNKEAENYNVTTNGIQLSDKTIDIPFLRPDAFQVFNRLLELILANTGNNGYGDNEQVVVWFKSGTIINDNSWSSTGYVFRFEVTNFSDEKMQSVFKEAYDEIKDMYEEEGISGTELFQYRKLNNSNAYEVFVAPRDEYFKLDLNY